MSLQLLLLTAADVSQAKVDSFMQKPNYLEREMMGISCVFNKIRPIASTVPALTRLNETGRDFPPRVEWVSIPARVKLVIPTIDIPLFY